LDVETGRFVSRDSFEGFRHDPITRHTYLYARNNPTNDIDPSGNISLISLSIRASLATLATALAFPQTFIGVGGSFLSLFLDDLPFLSNLQEQSLAQESPLVALKVKLAAVIAQSQTTFFYYDGFLNGNADAFRHAYWNALMLRTVGKDWAERWADAHENGAPRNPPLQKRMDLFNNRLGRIIGESGTVNLSREVLLNIRAGAGKRIDANQILVPTNGDQEWFWFV
jgi:hypothetical protein